MIARNQRQAAAKSSMEAEHAIRGFSAGHRVSSLLLLLNLVQSIKQTAVAPSHLQAPLSASASAGAGACSGPRLL